MSTQSFQIGANQAEPSILVNIFAIANGKLARLIFALRVRAGTSSPHVESNSFLPKLYAFLYRNISTPPDQPLQPSTSLVD
jgi:hypothetical protein